MAMQAMIRAMEMLKIQYSDSSMMVSEWIHECMSEKRSFFAKKKKLYENKN
jgi:hypothetical protein